MAESVTSTVHCDVCATDVPVTGKASPAMVLGIHQRQKHNIAGKHAGRKKRPPTRRAPDEPMPAGLPADEMPTPLSVVHDARDEISARKGAPSADDLTKALGRAYGLVATFAWSALVDTDPRYRDDDERQAVVEQLAPTAGEAAATVRPAARALAQLDWMKQHGRQLVENIDALDTVYVIAEQVRRGRAYIAERRAYERAVAGGTAQQLHTVGPPAGGGLDANAYVPPAQPAANGNGGLAPGTVVSYETLHGGQSPHANFPDATTEA